MHFRLLSDIHTSSAAQSWYLLRIRSLFNCHRLIAGVLASLCRSYRAKTATVEWSLGSKGGERERERNKHKAEGEGGEINGIFFPVNCISLSAEDSREDICKVLNSNLSLYLSPVSRCSLAYQLCLSGLSFLPFLDVLHLLSHDCCREVRRLEQQSVTQLYSDSGSSRAGYKNTTWLHLFKKHSRNLREEPVSCRQQTTVKKLITFKHILRKWCCSKGTKWFK